MSDKTVREQIMVAVMEHLTTEARPAGIPEPVRTRLSSPKPSQLPALTVYQGSEIVDPGHDESKGRARRTAVVRRALDIEVEYVVKAVQGTPADAEADPISVWVSAAMVSIGRIVTSGAPGGLAHDPPEEQGTVPKYEQGEYSFCRFTTTWRVFYQSSTSDATSLT
jgi:hypothetical protein